MNILVTKDSQTKISGHTYERCLHAVFDYLRKKPFIRNRDMRAITGITYDQTITFFNRAITEKHLHRGGRGSGTHYVLYEK